MTAVVLLTGMGGALGTRVAALLEADPGVEVVGVDADPPRRRLRRAEFHRVDLADRERLRQLVRDVEPTLLVHLGVYEPNARTGASTAAAWTASFAEAVLDPEVATPRLEGIVVRSGIEVYGRGRRSPGRPDEAAAVHPTSPFGRSLAAVETAAALAGHAANAPVTLLRCAPVVGSHLASPLGRYLRLPVVPVSATSCRRFSLLHMEDAAAAVVAALGSEVAGPVNLVGEGAVSPLAAVRRGGRMPLPVVGPGWLAARAGAELLGAPLPAHVRELLTRGRTADGGRAAEALGWVPTRTTLDVVDELYAWAPVTYQVPTRDESATDL